MTLIVIIILITLSTMIEHGMHVKYTYSSSFRYEPPSTFIYGSRSGPLKHLSPTCSLYMRVYRPSTSSNRYDDSDRDPSSTISTTRSLWRSHTLGPISQISNEFNDNLTFSHDAYLAAIDNHSSFPIELSFMLYIESQWGRKLSYRGYRISEV